MAEKRFQVGFTLAVPAGVSITRARLHLDAPGCAVVYANGRPGSDPAGICMWTQWPRTQIFITHDLTAYVHAGAPVGPMGVLSLSCALSFFVACARSYTRRPCRALIGASGG